jgi:pimeloyl-ACP methyl ester carboxylesterase
VPYRITRFSDRFLVGQLNVRGFESRRIATSMGLTHVLDARGRGNLPPLLVLHGFSAAGYLYEGVLTRMRPHVRRVIAPDMLGHGFSAMPQAGLDHQSLRAALLETVDRIVDEPVVVFGNSMGGAAALCLAIERPEKVRALFLVAPGGAPMEGDELRTFINRFRLRNHDEALDFVDRLFHKPHPMRQVLAWGTRMQFSRPGLRELLERMAPGEFVRAHDLAKLTMPIHVLWGAADRVLHPSHLDFYQRHLPAHAQIQVVEHFGHVPHIDHPEELYRRLLAFATDLETRPLAGQGLADRPNFVPVSSVAAP